MSNEDDESDCINFENKNRNLLAHILWTMLVLAICFCIAGTNLYHLYKFWKKRGKSRVIDSRHPDLILAIILCGIPITIILIPMAIDVYSIECISDISVLYLKNETKRNIIQDCLILPFVIFFFAWLFLIVLRVWLSRYDYEQNLAYKLTAWQKDLGYSTVDKDGKPVAYVSGEWWIKNKKKYGEEWPMIKILSCFYAPVMIIAIVISPLTEFFDDWDFFLYFVSFCACITCFFIVLNVYKIRNIHDNLHIKDEIMTFAKSAIFIAIILLFFFILGRAFEQIFYDYTTLITGLLLAGLLFSVAFVQTRWVEIAILKKTQQKSQYLLDHLTEEKENKTTLTTILSTKDGFEVFMDFLVSEYSTENLLCYVECTQFLRRWKHNISKLRREKQREEATHIVEEKRLGLSQTAKIANALAAHEAKEDLPLKINNSNQNKFEENVQKFVDVVSDVVSDPVKAAIGESDSDSSTSEDDVELDDNFNQNKVSKQNAMLNKFKYIKKTAILKDKNLTLWKHFDYVRKKYVDKSSEKQINIRSSLYREFNRCFETDCDLSNMDLGSISFLQLFSPSRGNDAARAASNSVSVHSRSHEKEKQIRNGIVLGSVSKSKSTDDMQVETQVDTLEVQVPTPHKLSRRGTKQQLQGVPKIMRVIDDTRRELWKLMQDSFVRFRGTPSYVDFINDSEVQRTKSISKRP